MAVRPNTVTLLPAGSPGAIDGVVRQAIYVGEQMEYLVQTALGDLFVTSADTEHPFAVDTPVAAALRESDVVLLSD